ncbi:hypothetical protein O6H91_11G049600 [Diphasiastrum complanatum]|uniref:Uncharacterized protein n=1 Tax=Diphasiastrum complanatum TaxID=34168 RepID=A0ACC2C965_DIPCM|nr:hypothetical protein O6H91_Y436600 [Diphasiastrum complanatum]KAJ7538477.1 hypothetical protein O6H91_11G049600 [Diphasiastrum complanatum]
MLDIVSSPLCSVPCLSLRALSSLKDASYISGFFLLFFPLPFHVCPLLFLYLIDSCSLVIENDGCWSLKNSDLSFAIRVIALRHILFSYPTSSSSMTSKSYTDLRSCLIYFLWKNKKSQSPGVSWFSPHTFRWS